MEYIACHQAHIIFMDCRTNQRENAEKLGKIFKNLKQIVNYLPKIFGTPAFAAGLSFSKDALRSLDQ